jgi:hypothetical protein
VHATLAAANGLPPAGKRPAGRPAAGDITRLIPISPSSPRKGDASCPSQSLFALIVFGAIFTFALKGGHIGELDLHAVGVILMLAGVAGILLPTVIRNRSRFSRPTIRSRQDVMDDGTRTVVEHTDGSQTLGLLQTEEYERAAIAAARPAPSTEELEQTVALRMTRQQILELDGDLPLDQEPTPRLWAIIDESALHRIAGSPQVMQAQRDHLVKMAQQPNVTIQVMPFSQGLTCAYGRSFTILTSRSGSGRSCRGRPERSLSP